MMHYDQISLIDPDLDLCDYTQACLDECPHQSDYSTETYYTQLSNLTNIQKKKMSMSIYNLSKQF